MNRTAERFDARLELEGLSIERAVGLAWLELWRSRAAVELAQAAVEESTIEVEREEVALSAGEARQLDVLGATVARERLRDALAAREQAVAQSRSRLARWIGDAAQRSTPPGAPRLDVPVDAQALMARVVAHPLLQVKSAEIMEAEAGALAARAAYSPDWRIEVGYGSRPEYADMVMVEVAMDLPLFTRHRQDQRLASALATQDAASAAREDELRQLVARAQLAQHDSEHFEARIAHYRSAVVTAAQAAVDAALAAWANRNGTLAEVIGARLRLLDVRMALLDLEYELLVTRVELRFVNGVPLAASAADSAGGST
ncbi:MAG: TolC family protein [Gammaproteobacteria bacterium]|nr:TolC family protein [Gammaproteobacteria bacterium]